jgi:elongation factor Tu
LCALDNVQPEWGVKSIEKLIAALDALPPPSRDVDGRLLMPINSAFEMKVRLIYMLAFMILDFQTPLDV